MMKELNVWRKKSSLQTFSAVKVPIFDRKRTKLIAGIKENSKHLLDKPLHWRPSCSGKVCTSCMTKYDTMFSFPDSLGRVCAEILSHAQRLQRLSVYLKRVNQELLNHKIRHFIVPFVMQIRYWPSDVAGIKNARMCMHSLKIVAVASRTILSINVTCPAGVGGGGTPRKIRYGCAALLPKPLPYLWPKSAIFPTLFMTWPKIWYPIYDLTLTL